MASNPTGIYDRLKAALKMRLVDVITEQPTNGVRRERLEAHLREVFNSVREQTHTPPLAQEETDRLFTEVIEELIGFGPLGPLLRDPGISEIMVNGPAEIFIERDGLLQRIPETFQNTQHLLAVIERMLGGVNLTVNEINPICDASLSDGSRMNVIIPPLALNGPVVTIRRSTRDWTMADYVAAGALSAEVAQFLEGCVKAKVNLVISGGTSSGKTTLVTILSFCIPPQERVITIENVAELKLVNRQHWIRLVGRIANLDGKGDVPLRVLVRNALRMRPDRIILGEARGGEALDVVQAMHTGHDGFITVLHANSARAALERLETLMLMSDLDLPPSACRVQIASAVDAIIHMGRFIDGSRRIAAITQVLGTSEDGFQSEDLFTLDTEGFSVDGQLRGNCRYTGAKPKFLSKFRLNNVPIPSWLTTS